MIQPKLRFGKDLLLPNTCGQGRESPEGKRAEVDRCFLVPVAMLCDPALAARQEDLDVGERVRGVAAALPASLPGKAKSN